MHDFALKVLISIVSTVVSSVPTLIICAVVVLSLELHLPDYIFWGLGTKLEERFARGDHGIIELDEACFKHDVSYAKYKDNEKICKTNRVLCGILGNLWKFEFRCE